MVTRVAPELPSFLEGSLTSSQDPTTHLPGQALGRKVCQTFAQPGVWPERAVPGHRMPGGSHPLLAQPEHFLTGRDSGDGKVEAAQSCHPFFPQRCRLQQRSERDGCPDATPHIQHQGCSRAEHAHQELRSGLKGSRLGVNGLQAENGKSLFWTSLGFGADSNESWRGPTMLVRARRTHWLIQP